jgi:predicted GNAT family acetyltransferase
VTAPGEATRVTVVDVPAHSRYEARLDGQLVGHVAYRLAAGTITFIHTEVLPGNEGRGVGTTLARTVLEDARSRGLRVRPLCPFIAAYIRRHPEHADLVGPAPVPRVTPSA